MVATLKIIKKLNQKIIKGVPPAGRRFSSTARRGKSNPTARALLACYRRDARNLNQTHSSYNFEPQATTEIIPSYFLTVT